MIYQIVVLANREDSSDPEYALCYETFLNDEYVGSWIECFFSLNEEKNVMMTVQKEYVESTTPIGAVLKFKRWKQGGLPHHYLMDEEK